MKLKVKRSFGKELCYDKIRNW